MHQHAIGAKLQGDERGVGAEVAQAAHRLGRPGVRERCPSVLAVGQESCNLAQQAAEFGAGQLGGAAAVVGSCGDGALTSAAQGGGEVGLTVPRQRRHVAAIDWAGPEIGQFGTELQPIAGRAEEDELPRAVLLV